MCIFSRFGRENGAELDQIGFDRELLDKAAVLSARMGDLLDENRAGRKRESEALRIRNQAYVHLRQLMNDIRECGRYVFYQNEDRAFGYASDYGRNKRSKQDREETPAPVAEETAAEV